jgi:hypothetical protein
MARHSDGGFYTCNTELSSFDIRELVLMKQFKAA